MSELPQSTKPPENGRFYVAKNELGYWCAFWLGHPFSNAKHTEGEARSIAERFNDHIDAGRIQPPPQPTAERYER